MKTILNLISSFALTLLITTSGFSQVKSDYDKATDFTKYKTYSFEGWQKDSGKLLNDFDKKRILDALKAEFDARGIEMVSTDGDAGVALYIVLDKKTSTTAYTNYMGGMGYGPRWGWGMGYRGGVGMGMGASTTTYDQNDYTEGTFVVDMYDASGKNLIWQGILTTIVNDKPEKRDKTIPKKMKKLMKKYPIDPMK